MADVPSYLVTVIWETAEPVGGVPDLRELTERVLAGEGVPPPAPVTIVITGPEEVRALNAEFLGVDAPTDVLSFPFAGGEPLPGEPFGELYVSWETVREQAREYGIPAARELEHVVVHGLLHLCGYDHALGAEEEERMRRREEHYLGDLGPQHEHRRS